LDNLPYQSEQFDAIICNAVLHFARDDNHFHKMITELWRVLKPQGFLFIRLASSIGIEDKIIPLSNNRYLLPDKSTRYLVTEQDLLTLTDQLGAELLDPIKTTNVQGLRCMSTWVVKKL
ncbi:MAG: methyltransferase domain-containing protein, partial [Desulfamplus sp.]|nr:methyltransferase domain-containing protein [Desulfamplus sp.]